VAAKKGFRSLLRAFLESRKVRGYSAPGLRRAEKILARFFVYVRREGTRDPRSVQEAHILGFLRHEGTLVNSFGRKTSLDQLLHELGALRAFFLFLEQRGEILASPVRDVSLPRAHPLPRTVLSLAEASRLMTAPPDGTRTGRRDRALLETLYATGIRLHECLGLDLGDLDLLEGHLLIRTGKGRKDRVVPIAGRAAVALDFYLRDGRPELASHSTEGALFLSKDGRRLSASQLNRLVKDHAQHAAIRKRVHPHALRHTCATHLLRGGASVREVQKLLGHRSIETTAVYTRVGVEDLRHLIGRCHPRERGT
jgi:integrase/recombinase XerD